MLKMENGAGEKSKKYVPCKCEELSSVLVLLWDSSYEKWKVSTPDEVPAAEQWVHQSLISKLMQATY